MRYLSIDILRGLAILLMIQVHFVENLSTREGGFTWLDWISSWLGLIPAPLFTFVAGVSYCLWLRKQQSLRRNDAEITKITVRRGLFLFGVGIAFNALVWLPEETFNWDVLTLIGTAFLVLAFARKLPSIVLAAICILVVLISPVMRVASDFSAYWADYAYSYDFTLTDVLWGFFANGYFPLFPWIIFPLIGFVTTDAVFARPGRTIAFSRGLAATGVIFMALAVLAVIVQPFMPPALGEHYVTAFTMFPASTTYVVGSLGLSVTSLILLHRWIDQNPRVTGKGWTLTFLRRFSAFSLTVYVLHHAVHLWPLWLSGELLHNDPDYFWRYAMGTPLAFALAVLFAVLCYALLIWLERHGSLGLERLMRWVCE